MTRPEGPRRTGEVDVGLRRAPDLEPDRPLPQSEPGLLSRIQGEIRERGPMPFARFMDLALYDPEGGYYTRYDELERGPGRRGDFLTAPESHPIFGMAVAAHIESVWEALGRPDPFVVREHGAGTGALAVGLLHGLRASRSPLERVLGYQPLDTSPARLASLRVRLNKVDLHEALDRASQGPAAGVVLANELLDALPVHRVEGGAAGELLERFVDIGDAGSLHEVTGPPSTAALGARLDAERIRLAPGQVAEVCLAIDDWVAAATAPLARGELLLIDYGHSARDLYDPSRGSLLRAYHRHRVHADPFVAIGRQDLTAHVDLTAVDRAAAAAGLIALGRTTQARFLADAGAGDLLVALQSDPTTTLPSYLEAKSALVRMLDPRATGAFAVLAFGRGLPPNPPHRGFGPAR